MVHKESSWVALLGEYDYGNDGSRRVMGPEGRIGTVDAVVPRVTRGKNATAFDAPDPERDANARLFAAAPDLYAFAIAVRRSGFAAGNLKLLNQMHDAIEKAEGK